MIKSYRRKFYYQDDKRRISIWNDIVLRDESNTQIKVTPIDTFEDLLKETSNWNYWNDTMHQTKITKGFFKRQTVVSYSFDNSNYISEDNFEPGEFIFCYKEVKISMKQLMEEPADLVIQYMKERGMSADCLNYMRCGAN